MQQHNRDKAERHFTVLRSSFDAKQGSKDSSYKGDFQAAAKKAGKVLFTRFPGKMNETLFIEVRETTKSKPKAKKDDNVKTYKVVCEKLKKPIIIKRGDVEITVNKHYEATEVDAREAEKHLMGPKKSGGGSDGASVSPSKSGPSAGPSKSGSGSSPSASPSKSGSGSGPSSGASAGPGKSGGNMSGGFFHGLDF